MAPCSLWSLLMAPHHATSICVGCCAHWWCSVVHCSRAGSTWCNLLSNRALDDERLPKLQVRAPVVTRFFWPPLMPRTMSLPTSVSWHTCTSGTYN